MANIHNIHNNNIRHLVRFYIEDRNSLPNALRGIPIGDWDVSHVTDMSQLFWWCRDFNEPLNNWNVSNVTNMFGMFSGCVNFNQPLNNWNVSNVTSMRSMFAYCRNFNQPLGNWNVSNVTDMEQMFANCTNFNQPLNSWNVSNVISMRSIFEECNNFNQPLNDWNVSNVTNMISMFERCNNFNQSLDNWNVSHVTDMERMFSRCHMFNQDLSNWNVSNVTYMNGMFIHCINFNQPLNGWDVSHVTNMSSMFLHCTNFNQPLNDWNVSNVREMEIMFSDCTNFNQPLNNWNVSRVTSMNGMFENCTSFNQDLTNWNIDRVRNFSGMFRGCTSLTINPNWQLFHSASGSTTMFANTPLQGTVLQRLERPAARAPRAPRAPRAAAPQPAAQLPQGLAFEVHNAFADLDLPKFMTVVRRENNGASNFKDANNILEPVVSYINSSDTTLSTEQKTRYTRNIRDTIRQNVNEYIRSHPEVKDNTLEVIQFVLSQDPNYKDLYIETFENECMGGYSSGNRQSCTKGMFERIYMANKGTIEGLCFDELQSGTSAASRATSAAASARANTCNPVYLELYSAFVPGADIDINDIFQKWYNQFSYDAVPEGENTLTNLTVDERKRHFRNFVRQDEVISSRIWSNAEFQRKLEQSIQANNIIFETLSLDAGLGRKRKGKRRTVKHIFSSIKKQKKNQRKTIKKQRKVTMKHLKRNIRKTKARY